MGLMKHRVSLKTLRQRSGNRLYRSLSSSKCAGYNAEFPSRPFDNAQGTKSTGSLSPSKCAGYNPKFPSRPFDDAQGTESIRSLSPPKCACRRVFHEIHSFKRLLYLHRTHTIYFPFESKNRQVQHIMFCFHQSLNVLAVMPVSAVCKRALWRARALRAMCHAVLIGKFTY